MGDVPPLSKSNPLPHLVVVTHDLIVAGELLYEYSEIQKNPPEPYDKIWEIQASKALAAVRFIRWGR